MKSRLLYVSILLLFIAGLLPAATPAQAKSSSPLPAAGDSTALQLLAGSHVLLFQPGAVTLAAADRQLGQVVYVDSATPSGWGPPASSPPTNPPSASLTTPPMYSN
jgi:hypothetical protein